MAKVAEDASVLLELFSKTNPNNDDINGEQREMIEAALEGLLKIHRELRVRGTERDGDDEAEVSTKVDAACIICYTEIADIVILPCGHLVLCTVGLGDREVCSLWC